MVGAIRAGGYSALGGVILTRHRHPLGERVELVLQRGQLRPRRRHPRSAAGRARSQAPAASVRPRRRRPPAQTASGAAPPGAVNSHHHSPCPGPGRPGSRRAGVRSAPAASRSAPRAAAAALGEVLELGQQRRRLLGDLRAGGGTDAALGAAAALESSSFGPWPPAARPPRPPQGRRFQRRVGSLASARSTTASSAGLAGAAGPGHEVGRDPRAAVERERHFAGERVEEQRPSAYSVAGPPPRP